MFASRTTISIKLVGANTCLSWFTSNKSKTKHHICHQKVWCDIEWLHVSTGRLHESRDSHKGHCHLDRLFSSDGLGVRFCFPFQWFWSWWMLFVSWQEHSSLKFDLYTQRYGHLNIWVAKICFPGNQLYFVLNMLTSRQRDSHLL